MFHSGTLVHQTMRSAFPFHWRYCQPGGCYLWRHVLYVSCFIIKIVTKTKRFCPCSMSRNATQYMYSAVVSSQRIVFVFWSFHLFTGSDVTIYSLKGDLHIKSRVATLAFKSPKSLKLAFLRWRLHATFQHQRHQHLADILAFSHLLHISLQNARLSIHNFLRPQSHQSYVHGVAITSMKNVATSGNS